MNTDQWKGLLGNVEEKTVILGVLQERMYELRGKEEQREVVEELLRQLERFGEWQRIESLATGAIQRFKASPALMYYAALVAVRKGQWGIARNTLEVMGKLVRNGLSEEWQRKQEKLGETLRAEEAGKLAYQGDTEELVTVLPRIAKLMELKGETLILKRGTEEQLVTAVTGNRVRWVETDQELGEIASKDSRLIADSRRLDEVLPVVAEGWIPSLPLSAWVMATKIRRVTDKTARLTCMQVEEPGIWIQLGEKNEEQIHHAMDWRGLPKVVQLALVYRFKAIVAPEEHWLAKAALAMRATKKTCKGC